MPQLDCATSIVPAAGGRLLTKWQTARDRRQRGRKAVECQIALARLDRPLISAHVGAVCLLHHYRSYVCCRSEVSVVSSLHNCSRLFGKTNPLITVAGIVHCRCLCTSSLIGCKCCSSAYQQLIIFETKNIYYTFGIM